MHLTNTKTGTLFLNTLYHISFSDYSYSVVVVIVIVVIVVVLVVIVVVVAVVVVIVVVVAVVVVNQVEPTNAAVQIHVFCFG